MLNFYSQLETIILEKSPELKIELFSSFYKLYNSGRLDFSFLTAPLLFHEPSFSTFCTIIPSEKLPPRSKLDTDFGKARFVHNILHIEYCAIDLALDHCYRFRDLPLEYYHDWLEVADDEIRHFKMLNALLIELGNKYGDFEVHQSLFDVMCATKSLRQRMAVIPRFLEANGLDANVKMMQKLQGVGDLASKKIISALDTILKEEISHVSKGDKWFLYACSLDSVDRSIYFEDVEAIIPNAWRHKNYVNESARIQAGFDINEINKIKNGKY